MGGKKTIEVSRKFEKVRRDKLNAAFSELCKLLPDHDPSVVLSKMEILKRAAEYIKQLQEQNYDIMKFGNDTVLNTTFLENETERLKKRVAQLLFKTKELVDVLRGAGVAVPKEKKKKPVLQSKPILNQNVSDNAAQKRMAVNGIEKKAGKDPVKRVVKCGCVKMSSEKKSSEEHSSVLVTTGPETTVTSTLATLPTVHSTIVQTGRLVTVPQNNVLTSPVFATRLQTVPSILTITTSSQESSLITNIVSTSQNTVNSSTVLTVTQSNVISPIMATRISTIPIVEKTLNPNASAASTIKSLVSTGTILHSDSKNNITNIQIGSKPVISKTTTPGIQTVPVIDKKFLSKLGPGTLILADGRIVNVPPVVPQIVVKPQPTVILVPSNKKREKLIVPKKRAITETTFANKAPIPAIKTFRLEPYVRTKPKKPKLKSVNNVQKNKIEENTEETNKKNTDSIVNSNVGESVSNLLEPMDVETVKEKVDEKNKCDEGTVGVDESNHQNDDDAVKDNQNVEQNSSSVETVTNPVSESTESVNVSASISTECNETSSIDNGNITKSELHNDVNIESSKENEPKQFEESLLTENLNTKVVETEIENEFNENISTNKEINSSLDIQSKDVSKDTELINYSENKDNSNKIPSENQENYLSEKDNMNSSVYDNSLSASVPVLPDLTYSTNNYGQLCSSSIQPDQSNIFDVGNVYTTVSSSTDPGLIVSESQSINLSEKQTGMNVSSSSKQLAFNTDQTLRRVDNVDVSKENQPNNTFSDGLPNVSNCYTYTNSDLNVYTSLLNEKSVQTGASSFGISIPECISSNILPVSSSSTCPSKTSSMIDRSYKINQSMNGSQYNSNQISSSQNQTKITQNMTNSNPVSKSINRSVSEHHLTFCTIGMSIPSNFSLSQPISSNNLSVSSNNEKYTSNDPKSINLENSKKYSNMSGNSFLTNSFIPSVNSIENTLNNVNYTYGSSSFNMNEPTSQNQTNSDVSRFMNVSSSDLMGINIPGLYYGGTSTENKKSTYSQNDQNHMMNSFNVSKSINNFNNNLNSTTGTTTISTIVHNGQMSKRPEFTHIEPQFINLNSCTNTNEQIVQTQNNFVQPFSTAPVISKMSTPFNHNFNSADKISHPQSYMLNTTMYLNHSNRTSSLIYSMSSNKCDERGMYSHNKYNNDQVNNNFGNGVQTLDMVTNVQNPVFGEHATLSSNTQTTSTVGSNTQNPTSTGFVNQNHSSSLSTNPNQSSNVSNVQNSTSLFSNHQTLSTSTPSVMTNASSTVYVDPTSTNVLPRSHPSDKKCQHTHNNTGLPISTKNNSENNGVNSTLYTGTSHFSTSDIYHKNKNGTNCRSNPIEQTNEMSIYNEGRRNASTITENQNKTQNVSKNSNGLVYNNDGDINKDKIAQKYSSNPIRSNDERNPQNIAQNVTRKDDNLQNNSNFIQTPRYNDTRMNDTQQMILNKDNSTNQMSKSIDNRVQNNFNDYITTTSNEQHRNSQFSNIPSNKLLENNERISQNNFNIYSKNNESNVESAKQEYLSKSIQKSVANDVSRNHSNYSSYSSAETSQGHKIVQNQAKVSTKSVEKRTEVNKCVSSLSQCATVPKVTGINSSTASSQCVSVAPSVGTGKTVPISVISSTEINPSTNEKHYPIDQNYKENDFIKNKDNERNTFIPIIDEVRLATDFSSDLFNSLQVPIGGQHSESISPTAAFLLAFPLVSTSKNVENLPENENNENHTSTPTTILQIGNIDPPNTELFHSINYQKNTNNKQTDSQYILSSEYLQLNETHDKQNSTYSKRCDKRRDNYSTKTVDDKQKSKTGSSSSHSYTYSMLSCGEYQYYDKDIQQWQPQQPEYQQNVSKEPPKKPCERKKDKGAQKNYYYQNYQEYYNYKEKKRKQNSRISVNWMSNSENREADQSKEIEASNSFSTASNQYNMPLEVPLESFSEFGPSKRGNNYSWSPSKSLLPTLENHLMIPSTLPTLVGDLALGTSTPSESYKTFHETPSSKNVHTVQKRSSDKSDENKKRNECPKSQANFFSVSQLVDPKSKKQKTSEKNCKRQDKNKQRNGNFNCNKRKDEHCMYYEDKSNYIVPPNHCTEKRYKGGSYSAESLIGLQQNEMEFPTNLNYQQNPNYFQNDYNHGTNDSAQQYGYFQQGTFTGFTQEEFQDWNGFGTNQRSGTEQNKQKSIVGRKEDSYTGSGALLQPQIYPPYSKNIHYATSLSSNVMSTNTTTSLTNFNLSTIFPEINDQRVSTSVQAQQQMNPAFQNQHGYRNHLN